ncbi:NAD(P)-binding protein [Byssothecium circinans]|uniref:NAD(P)-binding protein n=1 Tax=Byssothecium circinans TaxID=147558 RepID=A0A6A5THG3_9PLEO|nr:NAD(P)-binding protein [Byssothecium circinans]
MSHNILITGGSGYLGGSLLAGLKDANLPPYSTLYALVRTNAQAEAVRQYSALPLRADLTSPSSITSTIVNNKITIIYHLFNALDQFTPPIFIAALAEVKKKTGQEVHFLFTTGANLFSEFAGAPTDAPLLDTDPHLYNIQRSQITKAPIPFAATGVRANTLGIDEAEKHGVRSYIFAPCIVYGRCRGFGNKISIQTVAIVKAAKAVRRVYDLDAPARPVWPVCHVDDNTALYVEILRAALEGREIGHGKRGFYLASSGSMAWRDVYERMSKALERRGVVDGRGVGEGPLGDGVLGRMAEAVGGGEELVRMALRVGDCECTFTPANGAKIGWKPKYPVEHILEFADEEVDWILENLE